MLKMVAASLPDRNFDVIDHELRGLTDRVFERPFDLIARGILADRLEESPCNRLAARGEFIRLQLAKEHFTRQVELLKEWSADWLGLNANQDADRMFETVQRLAAADMLHLVSRREVRDAVMGIEPFEIMTGNGYGGQPIAVGFNKVGGNSTYFSFADGFLCRAIGSEQFIEPRLPGILAMFPGGEVGRLSGGTMWIHRSDSTEVYARITNSSAYGHQTV